MATGVGAPPRAPSHCIAAAAAALALLAEPLQCVIL